MPSGSPRPKQQRAGVQLPVEPVASLLPSLGCVLSSRGLNKDIPVVLGRPVCSTQATGMHAISSRKTQNGMTAQVTEAFSIPGFCHLLRDFQSCCSHAPPLEGRQGMSFRTVQVSEFQAFLSFLLSLSYFYFILFIYF